MKIIEVLKGERISVVVPEREDTVIWYKGINNIETQFFLNQPGIIIHLESEYEYYDSLKKQETQRTFSILVRESKKNIGNISLMDIYYKNRNTLMGVMLCDIEE